MEKRRFARMQTGTTVHFATTEGPIGDGDLVALSEYGDGSVADLSKGGFHVAFVNPARLGRLQTGQQLEFRFHIPTGWVNGRATVEWIRPEASEVGLAFDQISDDESVHALREYLSSLLFGVERP